MGRLIAADRLKAHYCWWAGGTKEMTVDEAKRIFDTIIDLQPTVDAEPVEHGRWIHDKWSEKRHDYNCSLCGCRITGVDPFSLSATAFYYCPECGANMDEVENAE